MAPWTPRVKIPSAQAIGTTLHSILERVVAEVREESQLEVVLLKRRNKVLREKVEALVAREQMLRFNLERFKSKAQNWKLYNGKLRKLLRAAEEDHDNYKREVLAKAYGHILWVKELGIFDVLARQLYNP